LLVTGLVICGSLLFAAPSSPVVGDLCNTEASRYLQASSNRPCCKICRKGKACGNSCISRSYRCHKGRGCACNG
jgi:hypothetical protein